MIEQNRINIKKLPKEIDIISRVLRVSASNDKIIKYQLLAKNISSVSLTNIDGEVRYFDSFGKFIGSDYGICYVDEVEPKEEFTFDFELDLPEEISRAELLVSSVRNNWIKKHNFKIIFIAIFLIVFIPIIQELLK